MMYSLFCSSYQADRHRRTVNEWLRKSACNPALFDSIFDFDSATCAGKCLMYSIYRCSCTFHTVEHYDDGGTAAVSRPDKGRPLHHHFVHNTTVGMPASTSMPPAEMKQWMSGDFLHPNRLGHAAMARCINLDFFKSPLPSGDLLVESQSLLLATS